MPTLSKLCLPLVYNQCNCNVYRYHDQMISDSGKTLWKLSLVVGNLSGYSVVQYGVDVKEVQLVIQLKYTICDSCF